MERESNNSIEQLVQLAMEGNRDAFSEIMKLNMNKVFALTYKMTGDKDVANDLTQDSFVTAWEKLKSFRGEGNFNGWLLRIAVNKGLNYLKRIKQNVRLDNDQLETHLQPDLNNQPDIEMEKKEIQDSVLYFMSTLPVQQRLAFELRFYKELSFKEIAEISGNAVGTVKTNYREAIKKLREHAIEKGWRK